MRAGTEGLGRTHICETGAVMELVIIIIVALVVVAAMVAGGLFFLRLRGGRFLPAAVFRAPPSDRLTITNVWPSSRCTRSDGRSRTPLRSAATMDTSAVIWGLRRFLLSPVTSIFTSKVTIFDVVLPQVAIRTTFPANRWLG